MKTNAAPEGSRERIFIVFRWSGVLFALTILLIFASGFISPRARGLTQALGITLVVAGVVALIQSNENLRGVEIAACRSTPVAAGKDAVIELTLKNSSDRERIGLVVRSGWRVRPRFSAWLPVLDAVEAAGVQLRLPTGRRGRFPVPKLWVCSVMPVGLCFAWKTFAEVGEYVVYPAPRGRPFSLGDQAGDFGKGGSMRGGDDVGGHREYAPGDLLSRMDWRVFARSGRLVVRTREAEPGGEVAMRWDDTRFLTDGEARLEQLSFWIAQCLREGRAFTLALPGVRRPLSSASVDRCLEALADFVVP